MNVVDGIRLYPYSVRMPLMQLPVNMVQDKAAFRKSMERIFATDFDNLIMAHGTPQMGSAKQRLRAALSERQLI